MTSTPLISLIIPCFNEAQRVKESLQQTIVSLSKQELEWELVIVDDGSTDNTVPIVESTLISNPVHLGKTSLLKVKSCFSIELLIAIFLLDKKALFLSNIS